MVGINIDVLAQFLQIKLHKSSTAKVFFRVLSSTFFSQVSQFENTARFNFSFLFFFPDNSNQYCVLPVEAKKFSHFLFNFCFKSHRIFVHLYLNLAKTFLRNTRKYRERKDMQAILPLDPLRRNGNI